MAKSNRSGQAAVLSPQQLNELWVELAPPYRLVTQIAYFTAARVGEVVSLRAGDLRGDRIVYRASQTKTKTTKEAAITKELAAILAGVDLPRSGYLFPSGSASGHITTRAVDKIVFGQVQATHLHLAGVSLRAIQRITGHATLAALERYLDIGGQEAADSQQQVMSKLFA